MMQSPRHRFVAGVILVAVVSVMVVFAAARRGALGQEGSNQQPIKNSYDQIAPVLIGKETFDAMMAKDKADKPSVMARQQQLLAERYDLTSRTDRKVTMTRGKPVQVGPTARLSTGITWDTLGAMTPDEIREKAIFPKGFLPLPHPKHDVGG